MTEHQQRLAHWVNQHGLAVRGYLRSLVGREDVADDLAQEVFQRAWIARDRYVEGDAERAYLLKIADRLACDEFRRNSREVRLPDDDWNGLQPASIDTQPLEGLLTAEAGVQVREALQKLTPAQRRVLLLRFYGEMSFQQIAEVMNCPLGTVLSHCRRGLGALKQWLEDPRT